jgi:dCTP deaminase
LILSGKTLLTKYSDIVTPFVPEKRIAHGMSYGLSLAGYDIRIKDAVWLYAGEFKLASSLEKFKIPKNVVGFVHDKSSWARRGLSLFNTVLEPGWEGDLTLELVYHAPFDMFGNIDPQSRFLDIRAESPIAQIIFMYTDKDTDGYLGKYQNQDNSLKPTGFIHE